MQNSMRSNQDFEMEPLFDKTILQEGYEQRKWKLEGWRDMGAAMLMAHNCQHVGLT